MNWYKKARNPNADIYGWPELEVAQPDDANLGLYEDWVSNKSRTFQGMAAKADELKKLYTKAINENQFDKAGMYELLLSDWLEDHGEMTPIYDGKSYFEVWLFEDGSMW